MAISNDDLFKLVNRLPEDAKQLAYDFLKYLVVHHSRPDWDEIAEMEPDELPLSNEEKWQLENNTEFMPWEDAMHELNLPPGIKS